MAMKSETLRAKLAAELGEAFVSSLTGVALAWRSTLAMPWMFGGFTAAYAVAYAFDLSSAVAGGAGGGIGALAATIAGDRQARNDKDVPGGSRVVLGTTADTLLFISSGIWRIADFEVVAKIPFSNIASIKAESRAMRESLTITLQNGHSMQLDNISHWNKLHPGLPHELLNTAPT